MAVVSFIDNWLGSGWHGLCCWAWKWLTMAGLGVVNNGWLGSDWQWLAWKWLLVIGLAVAGFPMYGKGWLALAVPDLCLGNWLQRHLLPNTKKTFSTTQYLFWLFFSINFISNYAQLLNLLTFKVLQVQWFLCFCCCCYLNKIYFYNNFA